MSGPDRQEQLETQADRLLREALPDDLPAEVESRLAEGLRTFMRSKPREQPLWALVPRPYARAALAVAAALLLASGLGLQAAAAPRATDRPFQRINLSVSLSRALHGAPSLHCTGMDDSALASPKTLADAVYRRWVPVATRTGPDGALVASYRSAETAAVYELVIDAATRLPRRITKSGGSAATESATCTWPGQEDAEVSRDE